MDNTECFEIVDQSDCKLKVVFHGLYNLVPRVSLFLPRERKESSVHRNKRELVPGRKCVSGVEMLGYNTACCHPLRSRLVWPILESDNCILYYPSQMVNFVKNPDFGCHVTNRIQDPFSREEERGPWERGCGLYPYRP